MKIIIDAFGGDNAPDVPVEASVMAVGNRENLNIILTGNKEIIEEKLSKFRYDKNRIKIVDCREIITNHDEPVKAATACLAFEHMEVAAYTVLFAAVHQAGDIQGQRMFDQLLREEQAMAAWLRQHLPPLAQAYLARDAAADRGVTTQSMAAGAAQPPQVPPNPATPDATGRRPPTAP